ncbi:MAG: hypothetical protein U0W24_23740 [Bacteroidales bacterium]
MEVFLNTLQFTLPSIVALAGALLIVKSFIDKETNLHKHEYVMKNQKTITPVRMQAYERIIMFLERISPAGLISRVQESGMSAKHLQIVLLQQIRAEFEHNISQQLYITDESWELVKSSKENLIRLINVASKEMGPEATAFDLSGAILNVYLKVENPPIEVAVKKIKEEFYYNFIK